MELSTIKLYIVQLVLATRYNYLIPIILVTILSLLAVIVHHILLLELLRITYTISQNGYIQAYCKTDETDKHPFI